MRSARPARPVRLATAAVAALALVTLSACGGDDESPKAAETAAVETEDEAATEEPTASESADGATAGGAQPDWAAPVTTGGEKIATIEVGDVTVDVFQVGTAPATKTGQFVDPETNKPIIAAGDELVFVNYVVTNTGDPVDLGSSLVSIDPKYDDWPYLQGMDSVVDAALFEEQGVNDSAMLPDAYREPSVYTLGTDQQYSYGENFRHQAGSPITFSATITPVDAAGELLHDDRIEGEASGTIA